MHDETVGLWRNCAAELSYGRHAMMTL